MISGQTSARRKSPLISSKPFVDRLPFSTCVRKVVVLSPANHFLRFRRTGRGRETERHTPGCGQSGRRSRSSRSFEELGVVATTKCHINCNETMSPPLAFK